ncbi:MAG: hypothetical protein ACJ74H_07300 [Thermoanaerobaculia bacterium]
MKDLSSPIAKTGFLQSRYFTCDEFAPAHGTVITNIRMCKVTSKIAITKLTLSFGWYTPHDYNGDQQFDDIFVIIKRGLGSVGL